MARTSTNSSEQSGVAELGMTRLFPGGAYIPNTPRGGIALPGLVASREETQYCWSERLNKQNMKWRGGGRSPCERPRTYDKFYQKTPGNFQALVSSRKTQSDLF